MRTPRNTSSASRMPVAQPQVLLAAASAVARPPSTAGGSARVVETPARLEHERLGDRGRIQARAHHTSTAARSSTMTSNSSGDAPGRAAAGAEPPEPRAEHGDVGDRERHERARAGTARARTSGSSHSPYCGEYTLFVSRNTTSERERERPPREPGRGAALSAPDSARRPAKIQRAATTTLTRPCLERSARPQMRRCDVPQAVEVGGALAVEPEELEPRAAARPR